MARPKNFTKQIEALTKKYEALENKKLSLADEINKLSDEEDEIAEQISQLKLEQLQQLMEDKHIGILPEPVAACFFRSPEIFPISFRTAVILLLW